MKKTFYTFLVTLCLSANLYGQITIDSMFVYQTPGFDSLANTVDSIYISATSEGQILENTQFISGSLDNSVIIILNFEGCDSITPTSFNTTIVYGFPISRITAFTKLDTAVNCSYPIVPIYTDALFWYDTPVNTNKRINEKQVKIYPNPARDILNVEYSEVIRPRKIQLMNINGAVVKSFEPNERLLDIQTVSSGLFFLIIETQDGYFIRKKVIVQ